jgi:hypothetical protein
MARGRGNMKRGGGAARGGGARGGSTAAKPGRDRVAVPAVATLPEPLTISPSTAPIPESIINAFPEFSHAQPYFSALERLNPELGGTFTAYRSCWIGISGEQLENVIRPDDDSFRAILALKNGTQQSVFVKRIHLLDPIAAMGGEYIWPEEGALPAPSDLWKTALAKINDPLNEAYVDSLFALCAHRLVDNDISPHWLRCYGAYTARAEKYLYNITDDYESLKARPWWRRNQKAGLFSLVKDEEDKAAEAAFFTEGLSEIDDSDFLTLESCTESDVQCVSSEKEPVLESAEPVKLNTPRLSLKPLAKTEDTESSSGSEGESLYSENELQQFVEFKNFPVQVTLLERAEGTMDELLEDEDDTDESMVASKEARWAAWLFQVIAALTTAQHYYGFVHNDLHTNNVMWSSTGETHLYYRIHKGKESFLYKVPTFGRIMKIIDFGRASYTLPDPAGFFISDAFYPGNDAATQYNCEPFFDSADGKKVEPNPSFDLCRLSVSLLESLYPDRPAAVTPVKILNKEGAKLYTETVSKVYNMLWEWLIDDTGKNVLRQADGEERYPDFDLYRAIAAEVHRAVPSKQIEHDLFAGYKIAARDLPKGVKVYDLQI